MSFETSVHAKCILSGEYAILQRGFAIVCPFGKYNLSLKYTPNDIKTIRTISGEGFNNMQIILWSVVSKALEILGEKPQDLTGFFEIKSSIPPCSGLGFSAALCVSVGQWALYYGLISKEDLFEFSLQLENIFHIKSSGVDVAGVMANHIVMYSSSHEISDISLAWNPCLYISSSGEKSITKNCMEKINELRASDPQKVAKAEDKMQEASVKTKLALESHHVDRVNLLAEALNLGDDCYYDWGLVSEKLDNHINTLKKYALACKVVGAGFGGHVVSLWREEPVINFPFKLHRVTL